MTGRVLVFNAMVKGIDVAIRQNAFKILLEVWIEAVLTKIKMDKSIVIVLSIFVTPVLQFSNHFIPDLKRLANILAG
jgi:hypothetical protein